ncbi:hypothetical protein [Actinosynnema sp. ALI-1.44]|nr:hypothetical protein [Actinosynnema sp. ALI-1.44]
MAAGLVTSEVVDEAALRATGSVSAASVSFGTLAAKPDSEAPTGTRPA